MIDQILLNQIRNDFYMGPDHEYLLIHDENLDDFWAWFRENSHIYTELDMPDNVIDDKYIAGRCIGNSQVAAIENGILYMEGFATNGNGNRCIFHGFNLIGENVVDVTAINHPENFEVYFGGVPNYYAGLTIPHDFLNEINGEAILQNHINMTPLLYQFYLRQQ